MSANCRFLRFDISFSWCSLLLFTFCGKEPFVIVVILTEYLKSLVLHHIWYQKQTRLLALALTTHLTHVVGLGISIFKLIVIDQCHSLVFVGKIKKIS